MKISCCIIGKNEVNDIGRCIKSVIDKVYEVIYVDTGSDDGTLEYVKTNFPSVKTFFYKWNDDFSSARNHGLRKAKGDFLFYLDCDEEFVGEFPENMAKGIHNFEIRNVNDNGSYVVSVCSRMISNVKGVCFKGKIHEIFDSPQVKLPIFKFNSGYILHYGYQNSYRDKKDKSNRNIISLTKELENNPDPSIYFYLGNEYFITKDYEKAKDLSLKGINILEDNIPLHDTFKPLLYHLYVISCTHLELEDEIEIFESEMLAKSENPECNIVLLQHYLKKENEAKILYHAFQCLKWVNAKSLPVKFIEKNITYVPYLALAKYYSDKDRLMALYFLEMAYGSGMNDIKVLADIYNLIPKCERNINKWEHYHKLLTEQVHDEKLIKDSIGFLIASEHLEKNKQGIEVANKYNTKEENEKLKTHLEKMGRKDLIQLMKGQ